MAEGLVAEEPVDEGATAKLSFAVGSGSVFRASAVSGAVADFVSDFVTDFEASVLRLVPVCDLFSDVGEE